MENRTPTGVFLPTDSKGLALVYLVMSWVHSKYPKAPVKQLHKIDQAIAKRRVNSIAELFYTRTKKMQEEYYYRNKDIYMLNECLFSDRFHQHFFLPC